MVTVTQKIPQPGRWRRQEIPLLGSEITRYKTVNNSEQLTQKFDSPKEITAVSMFNRCKSRQAFRQ